MTTSMRSRAEFLRKLRDFDLDQYAKFFTDTTPQGLGIFTMQRMAFHCGANHERVKDEDVKKDIEDKLIGFGIPEGSRHDIRALYWECVYAAVQEHRSRFSVNKDDFLLPSMKGNVTTGVLP